MKNILFITFIVLCLLPLVTSAPPNFELATPDGLIIEPTFPEFLRTGEDYEFEIHVFNYSNGIPVTSGVTCYFHLYFQDGVHIFEGEDNTISHLFDYSFDVAGGNFTQRGEYFAKIQCNNTLYGGASEIDFHVNDYGLTLMDSEQEMFNAGIIFLGVFFLITLFGIFKIDNATGKLACYWVCHVLFIIMTFSVWQFNQGFAVGYIGIAGVFKILFYVSITAMIPMVLLSVTWIFYIHLMNDTIKGFMDRGMDETEATERARRKY